MPATITVNLVEELNDRVVIAAGRAGMSFEDYVVDAIVRAVEDTLTSVDFHQSADARWENVLETGKTVPWDVAKARIAALVRAKQLRKPAR